MLPIDMKIYSIAFSAFLLLNFGIGCKSSTEIVQFSNTYETREIGIAKEGTVGFEITSEGSTTEAAIERAKIDAVHALLFKGVAGSGMDKPLLRKPDKSLSDHLPYFKEFFGIEHVETRTSGDAIRYGPSSAKYHTYIISTNQDEIPAGKIIKIPGGRRVSLQVYINKRALRKQLEEDKIIEKLF